MKEPMFKCFVDLSPCSAFDSTIGEVAKPDWVDALKEALKNVIDTDIKFNKVSASHVEITGDKILANDIAKYFIITILATLEKFGDYYSARIYFKDTTGHPQMKMALSDALMRKLLMAQENET